MRLRSTITGLLLAGLTALHAASLALDSLPNWPCMGVPVINYTPETSWEFGAAAQAYLRIQGERTSILQVDGAYSLKKQWYANTQGTLYLGTTLPWQLQFRAGYRNYPDTYYGIGNTSTLDGTRARKGERYASQRAYGFVQPMVSVGRGWQVGAHADMLWERTLMASETEASEILMTGIGLAGGYDTRDVLYYPSSGMFLRISATEHFSARNTFMALTRLHIDWRQFVPCGHDIVWAYQVCADMTLSPKGADVPFQMLPAIGGQDRLRGIPYGMFRDNTALSFQTELRVPIWRWIRACAFAGIGDVYDYRHWQWSIPKVGYGLGLRLTINHAKINIRADVARNNIYPSWSDIRGYGFYLTATEAF